MNENQRKQKEEARRESEEKTYNVCADGQKKAEKAYEPSFNQINNE